MQINETTAQKEIGYPLERASKEAAQKTQNSQENKTSAAKIEPYSAEFSAWAARLSASEFYAQNKLFFSQPAEAQNTIASIVDKLTAVVFDNAQDDENLLKSAKIGLLEGFERARKNWGGNASEASQKTLDKTIETIDLRLHSLGFALLRAIA
ncbi:MAG: hypothetical protein LBQ52_09290 [Helicobacteraceae bacterium]|jgi:hypothetical protein|nr:hypothetical protein [Helicobacteraceae bacterium]